MAAVLRPCDANILVANASLAFAQEDTNVYNINLISTKKVFEVITWRKQDENEVGNTYYHAALVYGNRTGILASAVMAGSPASNRLGALKDVLDKVERHLGAKVSDRVADLESARYE